MGIYNDTIKEILHDYNTLVKEEQKWPQNGP